MGLELMGVTQAPSPAPALAVMNSSAAAPAAATSLAPGFRFHPTDEELVRYYLRRKACGKPFRFQAVSDIDVYKCEPWQLADYSSLKTRDLEWYFFSPVDRKYCNGSRLNRATDNGYWKATGKDRHVRHKSQTIGMKKTLVFHSGRAPDGKRTNWVMHEYRLLDEELQRAGVAQDVFVLCRIFQKSGLGPPNGDRYAPFIEEEWDDDSALFVPGGEADDDLANGDDPRAEGGNDFGQENPFTKGLLHQNESPIDPQVNPFPCKREHRESSANPESLSLFDSNKRSKLSDPNTIGSEDSTTTSQDPRIANSKSTLLEFPLLETIETNKDNHPPAIPQSFDASTLEKSVPPGFLNLISRLENEVINASMERETLKIEVMRAQAMINVLQSRVELMSKENEDLRRYI